VRSDRHGRERSNELTEGMPMAGGGGSMLARGEEVTAFIAGREAVGRYLRIKAARGGGGRGMGRGVAGVRRKGRQRAGGHRPMAVRGRRGVAGVQAARSTVQGTHTRHTQGLGLDTRSIGRRPASAFVYGRYGSSLHGALAQRRARSRSRAFRRQDHSG
jgi:hypothetical protein